MKSIHRLALLFVSLFALLIALAPPAVRATDISVTAANVLASAQGNVITGTLGEAATRGKVVYLSSDGKYYLCDCTVAAKAVPAGIVLNDGGANQPVSICTEDPMFRPGATLSTSAPVYVLSTSGGIAPIADLAANDYCVVVFVTTTSTGTYAAFRAGGHVGKTLVTSP